MKWKNLKKIHHDKMNRLNPSVEEPPDMELKELPLHLKYAFLETNSRLPVIIASDLSPE